jgi:molybdopterin-guanine dinucleotide biosynthesis protein B
MIPIISIVGERGSGKTALIEKVISELKGRGYSVGTIKHTKDDKIKINYEGKDSFRHLQAGADCVAISSPHKIILQKNVTTELSLDKIVEFYLSGVDIVITEGYRKEKKPKIEIITEEAPLSPLFELIGVISEKELDLAIPSFKHDEVTKLVDLIEEKFLKLKQDTSLILRVDGEEVKLNNFVRSFIKNTILGMLSSLKGVENPQEILLKIKFR